MTKVIPLIKGESERVERYLPKAEYYIKHYYYKVKDVVRSRFNYEIKDKVLYDIIGTSKEYLQGALLSIPSQLANILEWIFLVPLFLFFLLQDLHRFKRMFLRTVPNSIFERIYSLTHQFNKKLGDYIFAKFIEATILGVIITSSLLILDVRFAFLFGTIAAVTNIIPYVGPLIGMLPGILLSLAEYGPGTTFYWVAMIYIVANVIDLAIIFPILVSKIVDLHPVLVVLSVILGSQFMGVMGMIISIPVAAALKLIVEELFRELYSNY